ncbi:LOB domain-containing protein 16-like [Cornus florida]|uniref:LOB domain-containing protein 16-like n=1 Tax=Cornus florida TaxID=4283 RepID=UPI0028A2A803|nr:LOB domain-containing protein 16-like [Cornus florida]
MLLMVSTEDESSEGFKHVLLLIVVAVLSCRSNRSVELQRALSLTNPSLSPEFSSSSFVARRFAAAAEGGRRKRCSACRQLRKACEPKCVFAPFDANFENIHKLYGSQNVRNLLIGIADEADKVTFINSLIWEALHRKNHPIQGSKGVHDDLVSRIHTLEAEVMGLRQLQQQDAYHPQPQMTDPGTSRQHDILNFGTGQQSNLISSSSPYYGRSEPESIPEHGQRIGHSNLIGSSSDLDFLPSDTWDENGALQEPTDFVMPPEFYSPSLPRTSDDTEPVTLPAFEHDTNAANPVISNSTPLGLPFPSSPRTSDDSQ